MQVPGAHPRRAAGLPAHDRVDHHIGDSQQQEHGPGGVACVMKTAVPHARVVQSFFQCW
ncbi:hypothetical protein ACF07T_27520 [Streptomyces sp. NPDC015184]|uniref:hypothetical protein n=1 Tax=Streptomyces sp. NPDC015184 TaxID=3364946 RepID=UPI0036FBC157